MTALVGSVDADRQGSKGKPGRRAAELVARLRVGPECFVAGRSLINGRMSASGRRRPMTGCGLFGVLQDKVRTSGRTLSYDSVSKIARLDSPADQDSLLDAALSGENTQAIREKTRNAAGPQKAGDRRSLRTERLQESLDGYTAIVSGPVSPDASHHMEAVVAMLLERLRNNSDQSAGR